MLKRGVGLSFGGFKNSLSRALRAFSRRVVRIVQFLTKSKKRIFTASLVVLVLVGLILVNNSKNQPVVNSCLRFDGILTDPYNDVSDIAVGTSVYKQSNNCTTLLKAKDNERFIIVKPLNSKLEPLAILRASIETDFRMGGVQSNYLKNIQSLTLEGGDLDLITVTTSDRTIMQYSIFTTKKKYSIIPRENIEDKTYITDQFLIVTSSSAATFQQINYKDIGIR